MRPCDSCGVLYQAKRPSSRFCSARCRNRNAKHPKPPGLVIPVGPPDGALTAVLLTELGSVGRVETVPGQQALTLARRMDATGETGSALAALSKEFRAVREVALEGVAVVVDPVDDLRLRRDARRAAAG